MPIFQNMTGQHTCAAYAQASAKGIPGPPGSGQKPPEHHTIQEHHTQSPHKSQSLYDSREDKVRVSFGYISPLCQDAGSKIPLPHKPPEPISSFA